MAATFVHSKYNVLVLQVVLYNTPPKKQCTNFIVAVRTAIVHVNNNTVQVLVLYNVLVTIIATRTNLYSSSSLVFGSQKLCAPSLSHSLGAHRAGERKAHLSILAVCIQTTVRTSSNNRDRRVFERRQPTQPTSTLLFDQEKMAVLQNASCTCTYVRTRRDGGWLTGCQGEQRLLVLYCTQVSNYPQSLSAKLTANAIHVVSKGGGRSIFGMVESLFSSRAAFSLNSKVPNVTMKEEEARKAASMAVSLGTGVASICRF